MLMNLLPISGRISLDVITPGIFENISAVSPTTSEPGYVVVYVDNQTIGKDVWFDNVQILHYNTQVLEENHYYPFGLTLSNSAMGITEQPLKYNGKELDKSFGLEYYFYGARQFDPQRGQWTGIDPLADKYYAISPFAYVANNPVKFVDPDGKRIFVYNNGKAYEYVPGVKPPAGSPEVLMKVHEAAMYNMQTMTGKRIWTAVGNSEKIVNIHFKNATAGDKNTNFFAPKADRKNSDLLLGDVYWDYNSRNRVNEGFLEIGYISPSTALLHEMGHVSRMITALLFGINTESWATYIDNASKETGKDVQYSTIEERENIQENEIPYILEINELERTLKGKNGSYQQIRPNHEARIEHDDNSADVNLNPTKAEQKIIFSLPD